MCLALSALFNGVLIVCPRGKGALLSHCIVYACAEDRDVPMRLKQRCIFMRHDIQIKNLVIKALKPDKVLRC